MRNTFRVMSVLGMMILCVSMGWLQAQSEGGQAVFEKHKGSVISFIAQDEDKMEIGRGTGFVIGRDLMVTNYHLLSEAKNAEGMDIEGKKVKIEGIISIDKTLDLAVVKVKSKAPPLTPSGFETLKFGTTLYALGGNEAGQLQAYDGQVINLVEYDSGRQTADTSFSAPDSLSGAPVFDESGVLVGFLTYVDTTSKFVLPANAIANMNTTGKVTKFKNLEPVEFFETEDGVFLASRLFGAVESTSRASRYLNEYLKFKPDDMETLQILARIETKQRDYSSAVKTYSKILELDPNIDTAHLGLGQIYISMMKWSDAIPPLEKAVAMNMEHTVAYQLMGRAYREQRIFDKAAEAYEKFLATDPQSPGDSHYELGDCYMELERFADAAQVLKKAVELEPGSIYKNSKLAQAYEKSGMYDEAAAVYEMLAQLSPDDAKIYHNIIVRMYDEAELPDKAIAAAKKMVDLDPSNPEAYYNLGIMYTNREMYEEAEEAMNKAIELNPAFDFAYLNLGNVYYQQKKYKEAIPVFEKLVEVVPDNAQGWLFLGICNMQIKRWSPAVDPLRKVIELTPDNGNAYYNLAIAYLNLKDYASAREVHENLKSLDASLAQRLSKYIK